MFLDSKQTFYGKRFFYNYEHLNPLNGKAFFLNIENLTLHENVKKCSKFSLCPEIQLSEVTPFSSCVYTSLAFKRLRRINQQKDIYSFDSLKQDNIQIEG